MLLTILELLWWLQPEAGGAAGGSAGGGAPPGGCAAGGANLGFLALMMVAFYFVLIRPQQKQQKERDAMLTALKKGDVVRTSGGIRGEIVVIEDREVTLRIADKTKINVLRSHVAGLDGALSDEKGN